LPISTQPKGLKAPLKRLSHYGDRARDKGFSISQTTLFIAASREMAWPDLIVFSSKTVHLHELASVP
jgi:hypothetical protein